MLNKNHSIQAGFWVAQAGLTGTEKSGPGVKGLSPGPSFCPDPSGGRRSRFARERSNRRQLPPLENGPPGPFVAYVSTALRLLQHRQHALLVLFGRLRPDLAINDLPRAVDDE